MNNQINETTSRSKIVALTSIMAALIAVTTMIAIPMPPPLSSITLAPIAIFITSILLGPSAGLISAAIGSAIGFLAGTSIGTIMAPPAYLYLFLFGIVIARAPMGLLVGLLRKKKETAAMIVGVLTETIIFFGIDSFVFGVAFALITLGTLADLIFVPISYGILKAVRKILKISYLA
ncbi:ECF transporter S component [Candidatus Bathyarchaeota archaeon]|nr:ECF transporter S component [Candidatus Bathyarchaeota archaeon]